MHVIRNTHTSFNDVVYGHVERHPDATAVCFLPEGEGDAVVLTYAQLHERAAALAALLQHQGALGERVVLATHDNVAFTIGFLACMYSGAVVVPVPMLDTKRLGPALPRLQAIVGDAQAKFFITQPLSDDIQQSIVHAAPDLGKLQWLSAYDDSRKASDWQRPTIAPENFAFLQYTSGSTGTPKGVVVSHHNLLVNSQQIEKGWFNHPETVFVSWLPQFHDFGLIFIAMQSLFLGTELVSMPPAAFAKNPLRWLRAISKYRGTATAAPNFAYDLCVAKTTPADRAGLDLSSMEMFANGAEPVRPAAMRRFLETFAPYGLRAEALRPAYGLAEATVYVSGCERTGMITLPVDEQALGRGKVSTDVTNAKKVKELVACGPPSDTMHVAIVDPDKLTPAEPNTVGEIWVKGENISAGYFHRPTESQENFGWKLGDAGPYLRTGDLGFIHAGNIYIAGRRKDMLIVHGNNYYPQDFEHTVEQAHTGVRGGFTAAFAVETDNEERLAIVAETNLEQDASSADYSAVVDKILRAITEEYEIAPYTVVLVRRGTIAKTSSGKIQRRQCKQHFLNKALDVLFQETFTKKALTQTMRESSSETSPKYRAIEQYVVELLKVKPTDVQSSKNLAAFGFDSVDGAALAQKIQKDWGIDIALELIPAMTIKELVDTIAG